MSNRPWIWWVLATAVGGLLGELGLRGVEGAFADGATAPSGIIQVLSWGFLGLVLGTLQWLVLRSRLDDAGWWIPVTTLAGAIAYPLWSRIAGPVLGLGGAANLLLVMLGLGFVFGLAQSFVLARHFRGVMWWVVASALAWPFEHFVAIYLRRAAGGTAGGVGWPVFVGWVIYGCITGLVLVWLLQGRRRRAGGQD